MIRDGRVNWPLGACKPRASGDDPLSKVRGGKYLRVNPARAGMIRPAPMRPIEAFSKPRASGDDPDFARTSDWERW